MIAPIKDRLRCLHCHLVLTNDELQNGFCPECLEEKGKRNKDFETVSVENQKVQYRCEQCGILIKTGKIENIA
ncbi:MAG: hypothetical protein KJ737_02700 [Proteobacteria bacterium]|nr:hypothetical protein [Pseudomonadota bacterium]